MKLGFEKYMLMACELVTYCHLQGAGEYHLDMKEKANVTTFKVTAAPVAIGPEELEQLIKKLNAPRQRDVEQEFWDVMGESETQCELTLIGMLCDEASVTLNGDEITIRLVRKA
jgi:hypothetical protein